jgi:hypothetical protein
MSLRSRTARKSNQTKFGLEAEQCVARLFESFSWKVALAPRSRGSFDIFATSGAHAMAIQVKATRERISDVESAVRLMKQRVPQHERARLRRDARARRAHALVCLLSDMRVWVFTMHRDEYVLNFQGLALD